ncbi:hypothetical protein J596_0197 [Acinetobacter baumannii 21072]|uniref:Uncharacterized protein n=1 Tax=Acinetobacter baumannii 21072 TaxID=1310697 RepID=A0A062IYK1_ACIBA|nr:hypothetical protein [Acinetobacter baumannii]KCY22978.1 hypothetical protein J596_0197 [Acinetobacter baumannii 21072]
MAVPEQTPFIEYTANGTTTVYPLTFDCDKSEYLIVSLDGEEAPVGSWSLSVGSITFNSAPANGVLITIERNTPFRRTTDYQSYNNSFRPAPVNKDFDLIWWKLQELGYRDQVIWLALVKEISDRIAGDGDLQNQINTIDEWLGNLQENVDQNTNDIEQLVNDLSKEIADRIKGDQILKDMFLSMIDEAINEGTINALAITHVDSLGALETIVNVWDGRTVYVKDLGHYEYDSNATSWVKAYQDADNVKDGAETQKQINDKAVFSSITDLSNIERVDSQIAVLNGDSYQLNMQDSGVPDGFFKIHAIAGNWNWLPSHFNIPCVFAKNIKTDGTDQLAILNQYAAYAVSKRLVLVLPAGTITINNEFIPPDGLVMRGLNENATVANSLYASGTIIKWGGIDGTKKAVIRCSRAAVGSVPSLPMNAVKLSGFTVDANGCDCGIYFRYFTNESRAENIVVGNSKKCNIAGVQLWFSSFGKLTSAECRGVGIAFGHPIFSESGDIAVNGINFEDLRAHRSGMDNTFNYNTARYDGCGIVVNTQGCSYGSVQSELNQGIGLIDLSVSRVNFWGNIYLEDNAKNDNTLTLKPSMYVYAPSGVRNVTLTTITLAQNQQIINNSGGAIVLLSARTVGNPFKALGGSGKFLIYGEPFPITYGLSETEYKSLIVHTTSRIAEFKNVNLRYTSQLENQIFYWKDTTGYPFIVVVPRQSYSGTNIAIAIDGTVYTINLASVSKGVPIVVRGVAITKDFHNIACTLGTNADFYCDVYVVTGRLLSGNLAEWIDF